MPFIDRTRERRLSRRPIAIGFAGAMAVLLLGLTWYGLEGARAPPRRARRRSAFTANQPCATCHTLKATGWNGNVGPNLDSAQPDLRSSRSTASRTARA